MTVIRHITIYAGFTSPVDFVQKVIKYAICIYLRLGFNFRKDIIAPVALNLMNNLNVK